MLLLIKPQPGRSQGAFDFIDDIDNFPFRGFYALGWNSGLAGKHPGVIYG
jgi:hypothetical protein